MEAQYICTRSALFNFHFLKCFVLLLFGILPGVIYIIYKNISAHHYLVEFYDSKYILKTGIFSTHEDETIFKGVLSVSVNQTMGGKILNYGTVKADVVGKHNLTLAGVKNPEDLKQYLLTRKIDASDINHTMTN